ncbi:MAG TPA: hypothetical protein VHF46_01790 [Rubrobacteraceae bacterium]|nr:hypothetical protein [Rubrobacteraceae bacterium]
MTSKKQNQANRQNALKSTGPKTPEGKASARLNATKHGLLSQEVLLPGEDEAALKELGERLRAELQPVGEMESLLVERIVDATWRLRRLSRVEAGIFTWELYEELAERAQEEAETYEFSVLDELRAANITDHQKHQEALSRAEEMKSKQHRAETATLGRTFIRDADTANAFSKLSRYETGIEQRFYKAWHELQRLQAARRTEGNVPLPVAVDVDVTGVSGEELR